MTHPERRGASSFSRKELTEQVVGIVRDVLKRRPVVRDLQQQWKRSAQAVLPLLVLGSEEDLAGLWNLVQELQPCLLPSRFFSEECWEDSRRLECALDTLSFFLIEQAQPHISAMLPAVELARGLLDGFWCIYALVPRGAWKPSEKPTQLPLF